jgi:hypothetical protein
MISSQESYRRFGPVLTYKPDYLRRAAIGRDGIGIRGLPGLQPNAHALSPTHIPESNPNLFRARTFSCGIQSPET